jgi:membrane protein YdbS with pleckstrin-like domain
LRCVSALQLSLALALASAVNVLLVYGLIGSTYAYYSLQLSAVFLLVFVIALYATEVLCRWSGLC